MVPLILHNTVVANRNASKIYEQSRYKDAKLTHEIDTKQIWSCSPMCRISATTIWRRWKGILREHSLCLRELGRLKKLGF